MKQAVIVIVFLMLFGGGVFAQFPQTERQKRRMEQSIKASEDRENEGRLVSEARLPVPRPAVMNVDVQMALSKAEYKTFAEAKAAEAKKIVDGDPLWLYIKFKSKLGDYVLTTRHPDDPEKLRYTLFAEMAPRGDITALSQYSIRFAKDDLAMTEVRINLAPGMFGRNRSIPVFLMTSGAAKTGVWNNEFRLTNNTSVPRALTDNLAATPVTLDFSTGPAKYQKMDSEYDSMILRGTTDVAKMPVAGSFFSERISTLLTAKLAADNILPLKTYFSGDDWEEVAAFGVQMRKSRRVFATFTYRRGEGCFYGVAEVTEEFEFLTGKFREADVKLRKDLPIPCAEA
ncbi:MAG: hypothetical protein H0U23_06250 [Blastocatellia bacterium]|nr:hypothetical protein [Blastocatellia bacterium]